MQICLVVRRRSWRPRLCPGVARCAGPRADLMKTSAPARRGWAAPSSPSPTMRRRPGGTRRAWPPARYFNAHRRKRASRPTGNVRRPTCPSRGAPVAFAVAFPALGLSYYRLRSVKYGPSAPTGDRGRTDKIEGHRSGALVAVESVRRDGGPVARRSPGRRLDPEAGRGGDASGVRRGDRRWMSAAISTCASSQATSTWVRWRRPAPAGGSAFADVGEPKFGAGSGEFALSAQARAASALSDTGAESAR